VSVNVSEQHSLNVVAVHEAWVTLQQF